MCGRYAKPEKTNFRFLNKNGALAKTLKRIMFRFRSDRYGSPILTSNERQA